MTGDTRFQRSLAVSEALIPNYSRLPVAFTHGEGPWLFTADGTACLDALSGIAVTSLGHAHPAVTAAIREQAGRLLHCSNVYRVTAQEQLAERLCRLAGMSSAFFCNSGAEANEAAIKLARLHGHRRGATVPRIVVMEGAFHGRTLAALTATGNAKAQAGFEPLVEGFLRVPYGNLDAVEQLMLRHDDIAAVLVEPVQGEGGIVIPPDGFIAGLRTLCDRHDALLMIDEVQSGMGRTGHWFAFQRDGVVPDVLQLAKALGNGVPIGATLVHGRAVGLFTPGRHGTTFGGNPLACAAAQAVIEAIESEGLLARAESLGARIAAGITAGVAGSEGAWVRNRGLMIGLVLPRECPELVLQCLEQQHLLMNVTAGRVVRLLPPLILSDAEADELVRRLLAVVQPWLVEQASARGAA